MSELNGQGPKVAATDLLAEVERLDGTMFALALANCQNRVLLQMLQDQPAGSTENTEVGLAASETELVDEQDLADADTPEHSQA
jgi:hypothetical protein